MDSHCIFLIFKLFFGVLIIFILGEIMGRILKLKKYIGQK